MTTKPKSIPQSFIGAYDAKIDAIAKEKLITARVGLLINNAFFGNLVTRMKLINADETIDTLATDGRNFYYNSRFVNALTPGEIQFGFGHEILHVIYDHFGRRENRDPKLANVAADYCVNADLRKHQIGRFITTVPCLYDAKYEGWSFEQVYDDLLENQNGLDVDSLLEKLLDEHLEISKESKDGKPTIDPEEVDAIKNEMAEAMVSAYQTCTDHGSIPAGIKRVIKNITEPKMDWRQLLRTHLQSSIKSDYSWTRLSRKGWHMDAVLPGTTGNEAISIAIAIDTSGSISDVMLKDFLAEITGITESFPEFTITVFTFDTQVYNPQIFTNDTIDELLEYQINGGGGTDFRVIFNYLKSEDIVPDRLVIFTDLECSVFGDPNYADTLWIVHNHYGSSYQTPQAPFGQTVPYEI